MSGFRFNSDPLYSSPIRQYQQSEPLVFRPQNKSPADAEYQEISLGDANRYGFSLWSMCRLRQSKDPRQGLVRDSKRSYFIDYSSKPVSENDRRAYDYRTRDDMPEGYSLDSARLENGKMSIRLKLSRRVESSFAGTPKKID